MLPSAEGMETCWRQSLLILHHKVKNCVLDRNISTPKKQLSYRLFGVVTRLVVVSNLYSRSRRAAFCPAIRVLHLHFSQQSQYAVGDVLFSLATIAEADEHSHSR